jgi:hypothetical protein
MRDIADAILYEALAKLIRHREKLETRIRQIDARIAKFPVCPVCKDHFDGTHICLGARRG